MESAVDTRLLSTPFVSSWFPRARPGDLFDADPARRAAAWAHWALTAMRPMTGHADRPYTALVLPGRFYDPKGRGPSTPPHLEIPSTTFDRPDPLFPDRLAHAGNGLHFPWWVVPEVLAVKRAVLAPHGGDICPVASLLEERRVALVDALAPLSRAAAARWSAIEELQVTDPQALSATATRAFTPHEVVEYMPAAAGLNLSVAFDPGLAERAGGYASRRIGVWWLSGADVEPFSLGVLTPRLTRSSLFSDPLFDPDKESPAALLVRGLLLRRILRWHLSTEVGQPVADAPATTGPAPRLRAVVARVGEKVPEASAASAVHFLQNYPDADNAWSALTEWACTPTSTGAPRAQLTVTRDAFTRAHSAALRALRRAEDPARRDIDVLLPLAWDHKSRVVRVTFARPSPDGAD